MTVIQVLVSDYNRAFVTLGPRFDPILVPIFEEVASELAYIMRLFALLLDKHGNYDMFLLCIYGLMMIWE